MSESKFLLPQSVRPLEEGPGGYWLTIVGAGTMISGIATRARSCGHTVRIIDRQPDKAPRLADGLQESTAAADVQAAGATSIGRADIVVLALPYQAARQVAARYAAALSGKTLVDNPAGLLDLDSLAVATGASAAEQIAAAAPTAPVVKAFNTTFAATPIAGPLAARPWTYSSSAMPPPPNRPSPIWPPPAACAPSTPGP